MQTIDFFYDFSSPYSFLAMTQVPALVERTGAVLRLRPFLLGAVFKATGNRAPVEVPAKGAYMFQDLRAWAKLYGVEMTIPDIFPIAAVKAGRMVVATDTSDDAWRLTDGIFRAFWSAGRDIREPEVLLDVAASAGLEGAVLLARSEQQEIKDRFRASSDEAVARGAFGAPTFFVGDQMFVGNDRLAFVERAARGERVYPD